MGKRHTQTALAHAIADEIHAELMRRKITVKDFAKKLGRTYDSTRDYMAKEREMPLGFMLEAIAYLDIPIDILIQSAKNRLIHKNSQTQARHD